MKMTISKIEYEMCIASNNSRQAKLLHLNINQDIKKSSGDANYIRYIKYKMTKKKLTSKSFNILMKAVTYVRFMLRKDNCVLTMSSEINKIIRALIWLNRSQFLVYYERRYH